MEWSQKEKAKVQRRAEKIHTTWPIDRDYIPPPTRGTLVTLDNAIIVAPPKGMEIGYVPIVVRQELVSESSR